MATVIRGSSLALALALLCLGCGKKPAPPGPEPVPTGGEQPTAPEPKSDAELLQGTWKIEAVTVDGNTESAEKFAKKRFVFRSDKFIISDSIQSFVNSFSVDATKHPKTFDMVEANRPDDRQPGIYELDGDRLKLCTGPHKKSDRPTAFESKQGSNTVLWVLVRDTDAPPITATPEAVAKVKREAEALQGVWRFESYMTDGKAMNAPLALMFRDNRMTIISQFAVVNPVPAFSFEFDATRPGTFFTVLPNTPDFHEYNTYELSGDRLKIGLANTADTLPTTFESKPGSKAAIWVLVRDKNAPALAAETDSAAFPKSIVGTWTFKSGETKFGFMIEETEYTADGRMLRKEEVSGKWVETARYRFDGDTLVIVAPKKDGQPAIEDYRVKVASISFGEFVAIDPKGTLRRTK